jgi:predicted AAA+ superfamily ATPase
MSKGCIVVEGAKWCGKSTTARKFAKTVVELQNPNTYKIYKLYAEVGDKGLLAGDKPLMFDEWQKIPELWDYMRAEIDKANQKGMFVLTGSTRPIDLKDRHTGIGRFKKIVMRPMSLWESNESVGTVSLQVLFEDQDASVSTQDTKTIRDIAYVVCRGGWPQAVTDSNPKIALKEASDYVETLVETELCEVDGVKRNASRALAILRAYARSVSAATKIQTLQRDLEINQSRFDVKTIDSYINALRELFVVEDVMAWSPQLRSKAILRTADTRQFVDSSIAATLLDANVDDLISDLRTFGLLFESLCIRDLRIYAQEIGGKVYNYRDSSGLEIDAIVHLDNGKWGAVEIKLGGDDAIENAAKNLLKLRQVVDTDKMNSPTFMMILVSTGYGYRRPDGIVVVPIGCLKS